MPPENEKIRPKYDTKVFESQEPEAILNAILEWANKNRHKIVDVMGVYSRECKISITYLTDEHDGGPDLQGSITARSEGDFDRMSRHHRSWFSENPDKTIVGSVCFLAFRHTAVVLYRQK